MQIMRPFAYLLKVGEEAQWTLTDSIIIEYILKHLSVNTEIFLLDVSGLFVLEVQYSDEGFGGVFL